MPQVVTCILEHDGKILILKRSNLVGTYRGLWGGVAGFVETLEEPYDTAIKEIWEEVGIGIDQLRLVRQGEPIEFTDSYGGRRYEWVIFPFLFHIDHPELVRIDWEHEEFRWIYPSDLKKYDTVPQLDELVEQLLKNEGDGDT
ncbi:MAG TPA: NUDIX pyrophosphatase [Candidatus Thermoplasmatota archaeon]|nr:NUDIX pyrophosphatase [Candidatus Thermoplasmatota archaeon]